MLFAELNQADCGWLIELEVSTLKHKSNATASFVFRAFAGKNLC